MKSKPARDRSTRADRIDRSARSFRTESISMAIPLKANNSCRRRLRRRRRRRVPKNYPRGADRSWKRQRLGAQRIG